MIQAPESPQVYNHKETEWNKDQEYILTIDESISIERKDVKRASNCKVTGPDKLFLRKETKSLSLGNQGKGLFEDRRTCARKLNMSQEGPVPAICSLIKLSIQ